MLFVPRKRAQTEAREKAQKTCKDEVFTQAAKMAKKPKIMCFFIYTTTIFKV
jgi:hypothetical protein